MANTETTYIDSLTESSVDLLGVRRRAKRCHGFRNKDRFVWCHLFVAAMGGTVFFINNCAINAGKGNLTEYLCNVGLLLYFIGIFVTTEVC